MTNETQTPIEKIRAGALEISIWANQTENGIRYAADGVTRSYKVGEGWKKTRSLSNGELLVAAKLNEMAFEKTLELTAADKAAAAPEQA